MTRPLRILITSCPQASHVAPMVPLSWTLRAGGHDVRVASLANIAADVTASGLPALPVGEPVDLGGLFGDDDPAGEFWARAGNLRGLVRWNARAALPLIDGLQGPARLWGPSLIIHEPFDLAGPVISAMLGVPTITHPIGLPPRATVMAGLRRAEEALRARYGLPGGSAEPSLVLDICPPHFGDDERHGGERHQFMRYVPYNGPGVVPDWVQAPPVAQRVCVMAGAEPAEEGLVPSLTGLAAVLAADGLEVLVPVPAAQLAEARETVPPPVRLVEWLPLHHVAPSCAAVVHHGDPVTTFTLLASGVPQILLPGVPDQLRHAAALEAAGAGRSLAQGSPASEVARAVRAVLADGRCRESAAALAREVASMPSPLAVAGRIEAVAA